MIDYYFADLPEKDQAALFDAAQRYLPLIPGAEHLQHRDEVLNLNIIEQVVAWQQLEADVLSAHNAWLIKQRGSRRGLVE